MRTPTIKIIFYYGLLFACSLAYSQAPQGFYQVQSGDTFARIALNNNISPRDLVAWNGGDPNNLTVGQIISLTPPPGSASQSSVSAKPLPVFSWPIKGKILTNYSDANKGVDIAGNVGDPIEASADGLVVYSGNTLKGYGNLIIIKHDNTYLTTYAHNSKLLVSEGQNVRKGQKIAELGDSESNIPKLHFEVRINGKPVNPTPYLNSATNATLSTTSKAGLSFDDSKSECIEKGFKKGTEDFGKCVLQLSK